MSSLEAREKKKANCNNFITIQKKGWKERRENKELVYVSNLKLFNLKRCKHKNYTKLGASAVAVV
jgi:hypothetical protein